MWGTSFNDLAKKAAEMQEQAAASMASPAAPSFNMGGMFNMDALQEKETDPDVKKTDESGSSTFYNPLQQRQSQQSLNLVQQPPIPPQRQRPPSKSKMQQPQSSFMPNMGMAMPAMASITPNNNSNNNSNNNNSTQKAANSMSFGTTKTNPGGSTAKNLFPSSSKQQSPLATPNNNKGKLVLPAKSISPKLSGKKKTNNNFVHKSAIPSGGSKLKMNTPSSPKLVPKPQNPSTEEAPKDSLPVKQQSPKSAKEKQQQQQQQQFSAPTSAPATKAQTTEAPKPMKPAGKSKEQPDTQNQQKHQPTATHATATSTKIPPALSSPPFNGNTMPPKEPEVPVPSPTPASKNITEEDECIGSPIVTEEGRGTEDSATNVELSTQASTSISLQQQQAEFEQQMEEQRRQTEERMQELQQQFSEQLHRLEVHHRQETEASNAQNEASLAHWQQQVRDRDIALENQSNTLDSDQQKSRKTIEKLSSQLNQARELIADKEKEDRRLQEAHLQQLRQMEKQCFKKEDASNSLEQDLQAIQEKLENSKEETKKALEDYGKLKERAKSVATELKERRAECRTLSSEIDLLKGANVSLQDRATQLEATGMDMNQSSEETLAKLDFLQASLDETKKELEETRNAIKTEKEKEREALSNYKKKAQQSLALANARSASAVQAREEAEMEARAARSTTDTAMERAMKSEFNGKQALTEAKVYVEQMKEEVSKYESVKSKLEETSKELKQTKTEAETHKDSNEKLRCELTSLSGRLEAEHATMEDMKASLNGAQIRSNELYDEVERLRKESQKHQDEIKRLLEAKKTADSTSEEEAAAIVRGANAEAEATIAMLQQELQDSNRAIKGLKETLKATMEESNALGNGEQQNGNGTMNGNHHQPESNSMPLFYAMEKQAELGQARDEIARLANLLGDAESTKQEALDEMYDMKQLMEDAQSKLQRQEQLKTENTGEDKSLNLEYLKNIVLSYLNAESAQERKALLPVIGTVLCLTSVEQRRAIEQIDKGNGTVIDTVATSVLGSYWS